MWNEVMMQCVYELGVDERMDGWMELMIIPISFDNYLPRCLGPWQLREFGEMQHYTSCHRDNN